MAKRYKNFQTLLNSTSGILTPRTRLSVKRTDILQRLEARKHARIFVRLHEEDERALRSSASMIPAAAYEDASRTDHDITLIKKVPVKSSHLEETQSILEQLAEETEAFKVDLEPPSLYTYSNSGIMNVGCLVERTKLTELRRNLLASFFKLYGISRKVTLPKGLRRFYKPVITLKRDIQQHDAERRLSQLIRGRHLPSRPLLVGLGAEIYNTRHVEYGSKILFYSFPWDWNKKNIRRAMKRGGLLPRDDKDELD